MTQFQIQGGTMTTTDRPIMIELYIQVAVATLALLGVATGLRRTNGMPNVVQASGSIDRLRDSFLAMLCFSAVTLLTLGLAGLASVTPKQALGASLWFFTVVLLLSWRARELSRDVKETALLKTWWLFATASRGALISAECSDSSHARVAPLVFFITDAGLCLALFAAYMVPARRSRPPLSLTALTHC